MWVNIQRGQKSSYRANEGVFFLIIHLYDCDQTGFPNLALLKLSAHHKEQGHTVVWNQPLFGGDLNFSSRVFTWHENFLPDYYVKGGWTESTETLPDNIEHICPDYEGMDYSMGFLSRGCIRHCSFCVVPDTEGDIRPHSEPEEFIRHKKAVLLDNNWLASPRWESDFEWLKKNSIKCDFNQGLDARLVDDGVAKRLAVLKFDPYIRFACDSQQQVKPLKRAINLLHRNGMPPSRGVFVYTLLTDDLEESYDRIMQISGMGKRIFPFAMPYRDTEGKVSRESADLARWVNHRATFRKVGLEAYQGPRKGMGTSTDVNMELWL